MTNTDSGPFQDLVPSISLRENERGTQIGSGWDPQWHQPTDVFATYSDKDFRLGLNAAQTTLGGDRDAHGRHDEKVNDQNKCNHEGTKPRRNPLSCLLRAFVFSWLPFSSDVGARSLMKRIGLLLLVVTVAVVFPEAQSEKLDYATIGRIRDEGLNRSQVMDHVSWLSDVYGPRLTGSPAIQQASDWASRRSLTGG